MSERSRVVHSILEQAASAAKSYSKERQLSAEAFTLQVEWRNGRTTEGFPWQLFRGYHWSEDGEAEKIVLLFGERVVEIEGDNLRALVEAIRDRQLNGIRELAGAEQLTLRQSNPDNVPIIDRVKCYPEFDEILKEIKGEKDDKGRFARRIER